MFLLASLGLDGAHKYAVTNDALHDFDGNG